MYVKRVAFQYFLIYVLVMENRVRIYVSVKVSEGRAEAQHKERE
jgi:hypothetical protein